MKKIVIAVLILLFLSIFSYGQTYEVSTSQGVKEITLPPGYTVEQAFLEVLMLYIEEGYDLDALLLDHAELITEVEGYKALIIEYEIKVNTILTDYQDLMDLYEKKDRMRNFLIMPCIGFSYGKEQLSGRFGFGVLWFQEVFTGLNVSIPYGINVMLGIKLGG